MSATQTAALTTGETIASLWHEACNAAKKKDANTFAQSLRRADAVADEIAGNLDSFKENW